MFILAIVSVILGAITFALELGGMFIYSNAGLMLVKVMFFISIAVLIALLVAFIFHVYVCANYEGEVRDVVGWIATAIIGVAIIVLGIVTLASGRMAFKSITVSEQYGVVYVETKTEYQVWKIEDKVEDVVIMSEIDEKRVTKIRKRASKGNESIRTLSFEVGSMTIEKGAFSDCGRLTTVTFADNSEYYLGQYAFSGCINLKEFNVGSAIVKPIDTNSDDYFIGTHPQTIKLNGGSIELMDSVGTIICDNNSSFTVKEYYDPVYVDTVVFVDGFDFSDEKEYYNYHTTDFFLSKRSYTAVAKTIYIPSSVTYIPDYLFGDEGEGCKVYYAGSAEDWAKLSIGTTGNSNYSNGKVKMEYNTPYTAG
ncbi:MAG: leucine-rich repeat protein [Candidatus Coproplasma sp.]